MYLIEHKFLNKNLRNRITQKKHLKKLLPVFTKKIEFKKFVQKQVQNKILKSIYCLIYLPKINQKFLKTDLKKNKLSRINSLKTFLNIDRKICKIYHLNIFKSCKTDLILMEQLTQMVSESAII
ncbi:hypothetical protein BpHYR1_008418 [Brachionus plicatilis]|uniref:Uncharacterized protein n=1 Tax=Brachionus plicatilis TaxID=10195 RepID=A0A3M7SBJ9_BRAPC|nr:hypothetical protein BpHYR1_008418 [Brachionus plicatilis]